MTQPQLPRDLLISWGEAVDRAVRRAARHALLDHKRSGNPIAVWENGRVEIVPPEEIVVPEDPDATAGGDRAG